MRWSWRDTLILQCGIIASGLLCLAYMLTMSALTEPPTVIMPWLTSQT